MEKSEYANAYKEVLEILKTVSKDDYNKIPKTKIEMFSEYANYDYDFEYNPALSLKKQKVSDIAQTIIAILFRDYWATEEQREKIINKEKYDKQLAEDEKRKEYNPDNIFEKNNSNSDVANSQATALVQNKEIKWYKKLWQTIKKLFNK